MALAPLATVDDMGTYCPGVDTSNTALVNGLLASVSAAVREAAGVTISSTTSTVTVTGSTDRWLRLPGGPVTAVSAVEIDGVAVTDYKLRDGMLWRASGWSGPCEPADIDVTYTQGYDPVPADIVRLVCLLTAAGITQDADGYGTRGMAYTSVDDYREGYRQGEDEVVDHTELPERTRADLAARFGGGAFVTGSRS